MNAEDFCAWLLRTGLSKRAAARALGVSESYVRAMAVGVRAVPEAIAEACDGIDEHAPPAPIIMPQFEPAPTKADLDQRTAALERSVRALQQRVAEISAAFEAAGLPIHQQLIPMTDEEAEEAELKLRKAQLLEQMNRAAKAAPGALTDEERAEADKARRMIAKARTLANGEPWE